MTNEIVTVRDPNTVIVNILDERGNVTESYNVGVVLSERAALRSELQRRQRVAAI